LIITNAASLLHGRILKKSKIVKKLRKRSKKRKKFAFLLAQQVWSTAISEKK
jgi:hypothetical protein